MEWVACYAEAQELGYDIVHPLCAEAWGLRRLHVRAPEGNVINIVSHPHGGSGYEKVSKRCFEHMWKWVFFRAC